MLRLDAVEPSTLELLNEADPALAVRSLSYFVDAELQPMPRMLVPFDWDAEKSRIRSAVCSLF